MPVLVFVLALVMVDVQDVQANAPVVWMNVLVVAALIVQEPAEVTV